MAILRILLLIIIFLQTIVPELSFIMSIHFPISELRTIPFQAIPLQLVVPVLPDWKVVSYFRFTGNSCSDTSGLWLNFRKITSLLLDSNFFSDSDRDVTVYANRLNDSYITNNFFSNYYPMNQAIHVDAIRARNLYITQNEFHGYESSIKLYCHGNSYTIEQNNILINQNNFYDVQNYAILLLYTHQIVPLRHLSKM